MKKRLGILLSGRGSNFEAIARNVAEGSVDAEIAVVIANRAEAGGLEVARRMDLPAVCLPSKGLDRETYDRMLIAELERAQVDLVCLAGYMRLLSGMFTRAFPNRILNIHPSLLPAFPGLDAQFQAWQHGVKFSGCTVHFVDENLDSGPVVRQAVVPVLDDDTVETLSARILAEEHRIYSEALRLVLSGNFRVEGRRIVEEFSPKPQRSENEIAREIVDAALRIHRALGPGLLESVYVAVLASALEKAGLGVARQKAVPVDFEGIHFNTGFRADLLVEDKVIVEVKSIAEIAMVHKKQLLTYLKLADKRLGLLINFNVALIRDGILRTVNKLEE